MLDREARWSLPVALATVAAIALLVASTVIVRSVSGDGDSEVLRSVHEHSSAVTASGVMQALAYLLLAAPLLYLFRAAQARSSQVRGQLVGLVVAAPLFLSMAAILTTVATTDAASEFVAGKGKSDLGRAVAIEECSDEQRDDESAFGDDFGGGGPAGLRRCADTKIADDRAEDAIGEAPTRAIATGFGLGGRLGLAFALFYSCLWAMRVGLLSRFWGSLGMAMGAAALLLLVQFTLIWFLYFALLVLGWVPKGRPPAWAAGVAIPWPTPGEKAAADLDPADGKGQSG